MRIPWKTTMKKPSIVLTLRTQHLLAYMLYPDGNAELVARVEFQCDSQTNCPLIDWTGLGGDPYQSMSKIIQKILTRYHPEGWNLFVRSNQWPKIREHLAPEHLQTLIGCVEDDLMDINISNVAEYFAEGATSVTEHV